MRILVFLLSALLYVNPVSSQVKVAILDFENTSGIVKYDGFGKALSNMLITDLKNSIHPRKISFLERSQLNKILSEQDLQKSKNFDKETAVTFGKLAGVQYVLIGSVYVMDGTCNISSRLVDVQSSEIMHAKESNGKISEWLALKSALAKELSSAMNNPVTIDEEYSSSVVSEGTINQYAKVIDKIDQGSMNEAQELAEALSEIAPEFKYFDELLVDIEELKKQVIKNTENIEVLKKTGDIVLNASTLEELENNLTSRLSSNEEKEDIIKSILMKYDVPIRKYGGWINDYNQNTYDLAVRERLGYFNNLMPAKKANYIEFIRLDCVYFLSKLHSFDHFKFIGNPDIIVTKFLSLYIDILKLQYETLSLSISESEFIFLNLMDITVYKYGNISRSSGAPYSYLLSDDYKELKFSVVSDFLNSHRQFANNEDSINQILLECYYKNYDSITLGGDHSIWDQILMRYYNGVEYGFDWYGNAAIVEVDDFDRYDKENLYEFIMRYNLQVFLEGDNLRKIKFPLKICDSEANEHFISNVYTGINSSRYFYPISENNIINVASENDFRGLVESYIDINARIYFQYELLHHNTMGSLDVEKFMTKYERFEDFIEFKEYWDKLDYPSIQYNYEDFLICDFIPEGTHVVICCDDNMIKELITVNSKGLLKQYELALINDMLDVTSVKYIVVDKPKFEILNLVPSHFEFLHSDSGSLLSQSMESAIYHSNRKIMENTSHLFYDYNNVSSSSDNSRIGILLSYMNSKIEEKLNEIQLAFPEKKAAYKLKQEESRRRVAAREEFYDNLFFFYNGDVTQLLNLSEGDLEHIMNWRKRATDDVLLDFFNTAFNELVEFDPTGHYKVENISRALIYNAIVFEYYRNIDGYYQEPNEYNNDTLKLFFENDQYYSLYTKEYENAARINTAHAFLVYGFNFGKTDYQTALKLYKMNLNYKFGESFNSLTSKEMIAADLHDLVDLGLIDEKLRNYVIGSL
jgi:TolB-like protein